MNLSTFITFRIPKYFDYIIQNDVLVLYCLRNEMHSIFKCELEFQ